MKNTKFTLNFAENVESHTFFSIVIKEKHDCWMKKNHKNTFERSYLLKIFMQKRSRGLHRYLILTSGGPTIQYIESNSVTIERKYFFTNRWWHADDMCPLHKKCYIIKLFGPTIREPVQYIVCQSLLQRYLEHNILKFGHSEINLQNISFDDKCPMHD